MRKKDYKSLAKALGFLSMAVTVGLLLAHFGGSALKCYVPFLALGLSIGALSISFRSTADSSKTDVEILKLFHEYMQQDTKERVKLNKKLFGLQRRIQNLEFKTAGKKDEHENHTITPI